MVVVIIMIIMTMMPDVVEMRLGVAFFSLRAVLY